MLHIVLRDVQNSSEDDTKRNMEKVAKGNKTIQKLRRHDMMNQKYDGRESGWIFGLEEFETAKRCKNGVVGPHLLKPLGRSKSCWNRRNVDHSFSLI